MIGFEEFVLMDEFKKKKTIWSITRNITNLLPCTINVHSFLNVKKKSWKSAHGTIATGKLLMSAQWELSLGKMSDLICLQRL